MRVGAEACGGGNFLCAFGRSSTKYAREMPCNATTLTLSVCALQLSGTDLRMDDSGDRERLRELVCMWLCAHRGEECCKILSSSFSWGIQYIFTPC